MQNIPQYLNRYNNFTQQTYLKMYSFVPENKIPIESSQEFNIVPVHQYIMIIAFIGVVMLGLWSLLFKQYRLAMYVHIFCMGFATVWIEMSAFLVINKGGFKKIKHFHHWFGLLIISFLFIQNILGIIIWIIKKNNKTSPKIIYIWNWVHRVLGIILIIMALIQIGRAVRKDNQLTVLNLLGIFSLVLYLLIRFLRRKMSVSKAMQLGSTKDGENSQNLIKVKNSQDLARINEDYFIFADKIYDIHNVLANHPGGYELIKSIRGREVDRYIYGTEPLELFHNKMFLHRHTSNALSLAGSPIGILSSVNPYTSMEDINKCYVHSTRKLNVANMYVPYLASKNSLSPFSFNGYSELSQFGKYFTVTLNNKITTITRLYSVVNFMNIDNIQFMESISGLSLLENWIETQVLSGESTERVITRGVSNNVMPLLMKKYPKSSFTSRFLESAFKGEVTISKPLGRGLSLHEMPPGELIFFAGGTGINPFCDVIDIMFKQHILSLSPKNAQQIIAQNPILRNGNAILGRFKVSLFYSVHDCRQLNEITANQLNELSKARLINTYVRGSVNVDEFFLKYSSITRIENNFQRYVEQFATKLHSISRIYACGPPVMVGKLVQAFKQHNISSFSVL